MSNYIDNVKLWFKGWSRFKEITDWKPTYGPDSKRWKAVYLFNYGFCVLVAAGAVEPLSSFMHRHRSGWLNDKVLDTIEVADPMHGARAGRPLWGSVESGRITRLIVPAVWFLIVGGIIWWRTRNV